MRTLLLAALLASPLPAIVPPALAQAADPAAAPVAALDAGLLGIMHAGGTAAARAARIGPVVDRSFDIPLLTRLTVGPAWTTIAPADQTALVAAFRRLTVASYAANFDGWSGQSFALNPQVETRGGDKLVRTTLVDPKGGPVAISYRLRDSGSGWRIIDVFYKNAISQLATRRADFAGVLRSGGAKALIARVDALAAKGG